MENISRHIYSFTRGQEPKKAMGISLSHKIAEWLEEINILDDDYKLDENFQIEIFGDVNITNKGIEKLPYFINFSKVYGDFYAAGNDWTSLNGFPKEIFGDFQIKFSNDIFHKTLFTEIEIKKNIKVHGTIWN